MARIGDFVETAPPMVPDAPGAEAFDRFQAEPDTLVIAVVDADGRPVGLIDRKQPHEQEREKTTILSSPTGTPAWNRGIAPVIALS